MRISDTAMKHLDHALTAIEDAERAIRRNMRIHPRKRIPISSHPEADELTGSDIGPNALSQDERPPETTPDAQRRKPIVSINGTDVDPERPEDLQDDA